MMFFEDLRKIRKVFIQAMFTSFGVSYKMEERFAVERAMLMNDIQRNKEERIKQQSVVRSLEESLKREKEFQESMQVEDYIGQLCFNAYHTNTVAKLE